MEYIVFARLAWVMAGLLAVATTRGTIRYGYGLEDVVHMPFGDGVAARKCPGPRWWTEC